jgi:hypothetical protein
MHTGLMAAQAERRELVFIPPAAIAVSAETKQAQWKRTRRSIWSALSLAWTY